MKSMVMVAAVVVMTGCASTRVMQREGCWVRETKSFPGQVKEEIGPCARPAPQWAEDRMARLVQECMVQADYRWQNRALAAWSKGEPIPEQASEEALARECMAQAASPTIAENENLKTRLAEVSEDREELKAIAEEDRAYIKDSHERVATALGEAAKKPAPAAIATATSSGSATTSSDMKNEDKPQPATVVTQPATVVTHPGIQPVERVEPQASAVTCEQPVKIARKPKPAKAKPAATADDPARACDLKAKPAESAQVMAAAPAATPAPKVDGKAAAPGAAQ